VRRRVLLAALGVLVVLVAVLWLSGAWQRILGRYAIPAEKQLVVLPFRNVGGDAANQAFCDGLTETLTTTLTQLEQFQGALRVVASAEVRKEEVASPSEARRLFGATLALSGSVQRIGERVRLTVNLVDTRTLRQLRAETIDTPMGEVSALQDGVAGRVADLLELELRAEARKALRAGGTTVAESYHRYVEGVGYLARWDRRGNIDRAIAQFQRAIRQDPNHALAHAALAEAFYRKFQSNKNPQWMREAQQSSTVAIELDNQLAALYVTRGMIYHGTGQYQQAAGDFQRALRLNPFSVAAHRGLAEAYEAMGRVQEAEATFRQAIEMHPKDWAGYQVLGGFYVRRAAYQKAEECYRRVTELTPDNCWGFYNLGAAYYYQGRYDEAIAMFEHSLKLRPVAAAYSNLAAVYYLTGRYEEAARTYRKAVDVQPANRAAWGNLGDAYLRLPGQDEKAKEAYRQAIRLAETELSVNPNSAEVRASLGLYCARLSDQPRALAEIAQARKLEPANTRVLFRCALAYELVGRRALALETLKEALRGGYSLAEVEKDPDLANLRQDPRFAALRATAGAVAQGHSAR
jgi:serine/threonine-protein kinase